MGRKIFVSYKHKDSNVARLKNAVSCQTTVRDYVDSLIDEFQGDEIYKGEGNEDLSEFQDETIKTRLKEKIHDSSITIVLISPNMKELNIPEKNQWISWEISYSLKEIVRNDKTSHTNAILAVVLPDTAESYSYFIETMPCNCTLFNTGTLFQILSDNMFNAKDLVSSGCGCKSYSGNCSYIQSIKWCDFLSNKNHYLKEAIKIKDDRKAYNIIKKYND